MGYDQWANLLSEGVLQCATPPLSLGVDASNRITNTGVSYDAVGNMLTDGSFTYTWNAESAIKSAAGVNYTYDGDGNRVQKSNGKIYWFGAGSEVLDESDVAGNVTDEYVFFGGKRIAHRVVSTGSIYYYAQDFVGSSRVILTATGTVCYDADFYPFGKERPPIVNTCPQNYKFTGKERDPETGNDDFGARYFSPSFGRWLSPDWSAIPTPVPYAVLTNPQTLNLYQYVQNNPETFADIDGHLINWSNQPDPVSGHASGCGCDNGEGMNSAGVADFSGLLTGVQIAALQALVTPSAPTQASQPALIPLSNSVHYTVASNGPNAPDVHPLFSPETASRLNAAFAELNQGGITPQINSAFRTNSEQAYMQAGGSGSNPAAQLSWHQAGAAVDINGTRIPQFKTIVSVMKKHGLAWGGNFKSKRDPPHFDGRQFMGKLNQAVSNAQTYWHGD